MLLLRIDGSLRVPRAALTDAEVEEDTRLTSCPNPRYVDALRCGDRAARFLPQTISSLVVDDDVVAYPVNAAEVYRRRLRGKSYELVDARPSFVPYPLTYRGRLDAFQADMCSALAARPSAIGAAPCGSGKTEVGLALIAHHGVPSLILVGQLEHARDWRARVKARLGVDAGFVGAGEFDLRRITVALVQSLTPDRLAAISNAFGVVVADECHHGASESYRRVLGAIAARRRYGLTATPWREDGLWPFVEHHLGPVAYRVTAEQLAGRRVVPRFATVITSFGFDYDHRSQWGALQDAIAVDPGRNALIVEVVARECSGDALGAVITGRIEHANLLHAALVARGLRAAVLTGKTPKRERVALLDAARGAALDVIVGTQILDEGVDVAPLSRVFLTWPAVAAGRIEQRVGRALRLSPNKPEPVVFDFVDERVGVLAHQARRRAAIFARMAPLASRAVA